MAKRVAYFVEKEKIQVKEEIFEFEWYPGFSVSQKQKSILSFHNSIKKLYPDNNILEISSKSQDDLGYNLSAFNLIINDANNKISYSVECAFQASKVFEMGGPFLDILFMTSREAKKDIRLKTSGKLRKFKFMGIIWDLEPRTAFYDWLYINALYKNKHLYMPLLKYDAFTDIEFNPEKSINCQAKSAALFVSLYQKGLINDNIKDKAYFLHNAYGENIKNKSMNQISFDEIY